MLLSYEAFSIDKLIFLGIIYDAICLPVQNGTFSSPISTDGSGKNPSKVDTSHKQFIICCLVKYAVSPIIVFTSLPLFFGNL